MGQKRHLKNNSGLWRASSTIFFMDRNCYFRFIYPPARNMKDHGCKSDGSNCQPFHHHPSHKPPEQQLYWKSSSKSNQPLCLFLMGRRCWEHNPIPARLDIRNRLKQQTIIDDETAALCLSLSHHISLDGAD